MSQEAVIFDGDDTLWFVEPLYDDARAEAAAVVAAAGLDSRHWESLQRRIDVRYAPVFGVSPKRFPESCADAYRRLASRSDHGVDPSVEALVRAAARSVFTRTAMPVGGVEDALGQLRGRYLLALLTKGDDEIQRKRIADAGLVSSFDYVAIVRDKGPAEFAMVLEALGVGARSAWSVGNSLASDINPALRIGMRAIWIDAPVWPYERRDTEIGDGYVVRAPDLPSAAAILIGGGPGAEPADATDAHGGGGAGG